MRKHNSQSERTVLLDGKPLCPLPAQTIARYSREFEWGSHSAGAALLALALLLHVVPEQEALHLRYRYAAEVIVNLPADRYTIEIRKADIECWLSHRVHNLHPSGSERAMLYA